MLGIALGVLSAVSWGTSDFLGGFLSRRLPALRVVAWSQLAGGILIVLAALITRAPISAAALGWGALSGLAGLVGLLALYRGLALGPMALVSPISACSAVVPLVAVALMGHLPPLVALVGITVAFGGIVLATLSQTAHTDTTRRAAPGAPKGTLYAGIAALGFGFFFVCLAHGAAGHPLATLWVIAGARIAALLALFGSMVVRRDDVRLPRTDLRGLIGVGVFDTAGNALYTFATTLGNLGIISVLGTLYPVMTVLLAFGVLHERLAPRQTLGVVLAFAGVALMALG